MRIIRCNRKISMYIEILYRICSRMCVKIDAINILKFHQHCAKHISRHRFNYYGILQPTLNVITFIETIKNPLYDHAIFLPLTINHTCVESYNVLRLISNVRDVADTTQIRQFCFQAARFQRISKLHSYTCGKPCIYLYTDRHFPAAMFENHGQPLLLINHFAVEFLGPWKRIARTGVFS